MGGEMMDWQEVSIDGEVQVERVPGIYEDLGFEVRLEEVNPEEAGQCTQFSQEKRERVYRVHARRRQEARNK
jgi:hypothetical protein